MLSPRPQLWAEPREESRQQRTGMRPQQPTLTSSLPPGPQDDTAAPGTTEASCARAHYTLPGTPTPGSAAPTRPAPSGPRRSSSVSQPSSPTPTVGRQLPGCIRCPPGPHQGTSATPVGEGQLLLHQPLRHPPTGQATPRGHGQGTSRHPPYPWGSLSKGVPSTSPTLPTKCSPLPPFPGPVQSDVRLPTS